MNLPFSFRQKIKIALFLFCIMASTLLIRMLEDKSLKEMDKAFSSIYNDRLVPATDLFQISEQVYAKRHLIEAYFEHNLNTTQSAALVKKLGYFDAKIDSLVVKYESTYLVAKEKEGLRALKLRLKRIRAIESGIASVNQQALPEIKASFDEVSKSISDLTKIQSNVGEELIKNTQEMMGSSKLYSAIQFVLAIMIGALIVSILFTAKVLKVKTDHFSLN